VGGGRRDDGNGTVGHWYQLIDDERHPDWQKTPPIGGALYALERQTIQTISKPIGEFNKSRDSRRGLLACMSNMG